MSKKLQLSAVIITFALLYSSAYCCRPISLIDKNPKKDGKKKMTGKKQRSAIFIRGPIKNTINNSRIEKEIVKVER